MAVALGADVREEECLAQACSTDALTGSEEVFKVKMFIAQAIAVGLAVLVASKIMPGVRVRRVGTAVGVAVAFALLNLVAGWLLTAVLALVLLPAAILTFGLVYLVLGLLVNMILLYVTDKLIDDFEITGLWPLAGAAGLISVAGWLLPRIF